MGNRAVIAFRGGCTPTAECIYLHWNGGRASIEGFLTAAKKLHICPRLGPADNKRAITQLGHLIAYFFFGLDLGTTVYIEPVWDAMIDNGDQGMFLIDDQFNIVGRLFNEGDEEFNPSKTAFIIDTITARAPVFNDLPVARKHRPGDRLYDAIDHVRHLLNQA